MSLKITYLSPDAARPAISLILIVISRLIPKGKVKVIPMGDPFPLLVRRNPLKSFQPTSKLCEMAIREPLQSREPDRMRIFPA